METQVKPKMVAIVNYEEILEDVKTELWNKLKSEANKLNDTRKYFTIKEVADIFKVTEKTIDNWNEIGKLCYAQVVDGSRKLFSVKDVNALHELMEHERNRKYAGGSWKRNPQS